VGAHEVRDVEALDPQGQRVEPERALQAVERLDALLAPALLLELLGVERERRVAVGQLEDPLLVAALGEADLDPPAAALGQQLGDDGVDRLPDDDLRRDRHRVAVELQDELLEHLGRVALDLVGQVERLAVRQDAVADLEDLAVRVRAGDGDADRVERADRLVGDALALEERAHGLQAVALDRGLLELVDRGGLVHPRLEARARPRGSGPGGTR
jgi:hypothetical protein